MVARSETGYVFIMTIDEVAATAAPLTTERKARLLGRLSFELTIAARDTYVAGSEDVAAPAQLRAFNEIQHRVAGCLQELLSGRSTDIWIWPAISEFASRAGCEGQLIQACRKALDSLPEIN
jgi:hypothetical protein